MAAVDLREARAYIGATVRHKGDLWTVAGVSVTGDARSDWPVFTLRQSQWAGLYHHTATSRIEGWNLDIVEEK